MAFDGTNIWVANGGAVTKINPAIPPGPVITPAGIVPLYSTYSAIQPGEWISIYGSNLASGTTIWTGDFPISLGGTSVTINGKAAYLSLASPGQINLQAPDDTATGTVPVVVTTANGTATSTVGMQKFVPSFALLDSTHVAGIILRSDGSGAYGGGTYDILGPTGSSLGYPTVAAKAGDHLELFGVGFGPTTPVVPAGKAFTGAATTNNAVQIFVGGNTRPIQPYASLNLSFAGMSSDCVYQFNATMPSPFNWTGDLAIVATLGVCLPGELEICVQTQSGVTISLQ